MLSARRGIPVSERLREFVERGRRAQAAVDAAGGRAGCAVCGLDDTRLVEIAAGLERASVCSVGCARVWIGPKVAALFGYAVADQALVARLPGTAMEGEWP